MMKKKHITQFMLELYHLNAVTDKERKLVEDELNKNSEVKQRYDELIKSDREIKERYKINTPTEFTVIRNDNVIKRKKLLLGLAVAAVLLCVLTPVFFIKNNNSGGITDIALNSEAETDLAAEVSMLFEDCAYINSEDSYTLDNDTENYTAINEIDNFIAVLTDSQENLSATQIPEQRVYIRGGAENTELPSVTPEHNQVNIPAGITFIFDSMFADRGLTEITIPQRITFISNNAFANNLIKNVIIPDSVTSIGNGAFSNNPLISITIGANVYIEDDSFPGNFVYFYNAYGKMAGTYIRVNSFSYEWRKQ